MIKTKKYKVDILVVLCLFIFFTISLSCLLLGSVKKYKSITSKSDKNFHIRTSALYISNKIKFANENENIYIDKFNGLDAICFKETIDDVEYVTRIYCYEGYLMELFSEKDNTLEPIAGERITSLKSISIENIRADLIKVTLESNDGENNTLIVSII